MPDREITGSYPMRDASNGGLDENFVHDMLLITDVLTDDETVSVVSEPKMWSFSPNEALARARTAAAARQKAAAAKRGTRDVHENMYSLLPTVHFQCSCSHDKSR